MIAWWGWLWSVKVRSGLGLDLEGEGFGETRDDSRDNSFNITSSISNINVVRHILVLVIPIEDYSRQVQQIKNWKPERIRCDP